jgi:hypothetical protein
MASNRDVIVEELEVEFADGYVLISENFPDPARANAETVALAQDINRYVLELEGVLPIEGDISTGIRTVDYWHLEKKPWLSFHGTAWVKVNKPNQFLAYIGWKSQATPPPVSETAT